jgi:hypothetical protein
MAHKFQVIIGFSFYSKTSADLDISKLIAKEKELIKRNSTPKYNQYPHSGESSDINLKNCKFTFDNN